MSPCPTKTALLATRPAAASIFFTPRMPENKHLIRHVALGLRAEINTLERGGTVGFLGDGTTYARLTEEEVLKARGRYIINGRCVDISKRHVDRCFRKIFGYSVEINPFEFEGVGIRKSDKNYTHDGVVLQFPIDATEPGFVYNRLCDNRVDDSTVIDIRVPVVAGRIPAVVLKERRIDIRFSAMNTKVYMVENEEVLTPEELDKIVRFCSELGLDFGELDVLRDGSDGRIYIVDANRCTEGPSRIMPLDQAVELVRRLCVEFARCFFHRDLSVDIDAISRSLTEMRKPVA